MAAMRRRIHSDCPLGDDCLLLLSLLMRLRPLSGLDIGLCDVTRGDSFMLVWMDRGDRSGVRASGERSKFRLRSGVRRPADLLGLLLLPDVGLLGLFTFGSLILSWLGRRLEAGLDWGLLLADDPADDPPCMRSKRLPQLRNEPNEPLCSPSLLLA